MQALTKVSYWRLLLMSDFILGLFTFTGGIFWILVVAWLAGFVGDKLGLNK